VWLGVDGFHVTGPSKSDVDCASYAVLGCHASATGVMAGFGIEGRIGNYAGAAGLLAVVVGAIAVAAALGATH
jgi:hypothetical protein